jgi:hypothetical protein
MTVTVDRTGTSDAPGLRARFGRLDALSALQEDWDSYVVRRGNGEPGMLEADGVSLANLLALVEQLPR